MPVPFYRYSAPDKGFPPFGSMRLSKSVAHSGAGSFEFELGGGSMSARIPTSIIPILPFTDYAVTAKVRTQGLTHARARLVAWLHNQTGQEIPNSRAESRLIETAGAWETLAVEVRGIDAEAADLVLELQVIQPAHWRSRPAAFDVDEAELARAPRLEDIAGQVWFDDVIVSHLPNVRMTLTQPGNVVERPAMPEFQILVNELTSASLTARLQVFDVNGHTVFDSTFPAPRGRQAGSVAVDVEKCGWYRALLQVRSESGLTRWQWMDFALVSERTRRGAGEHRFGVALPRHDSSVQSVVPEMVRHSACGAATVPVWDRDSSVKKTPELAQRQQALHEMIEQLLRRDVELTFALDVAPEELARAANIDARQVLDLLAKGPQHWQPYLDDVLVNFGLEVNRWQIGSVPEVEAIRTERLRPSYDAAYESLAAFVPKAVLYATYSVDHSVPKDDELPAYAVAVPYQVGPDSIAAYLQQIPGHDQSALLISLPEEHYTARQRLADLMVRGLHAWRTDMRTVFIPAPWTEPISQQASATITPKPAFVAWRTLAEQLRGRTFVAELPLSDGMHCWLLRGGESTDSALVAWSDAPQTLHEQLAGGPVTVIDAFGNRSAAHPANGIHSIALDDLPIFIEQANLSLVQFRGGVAIEPHFVPAIAKIHEHQIVIHNPWNISVSGGIRLVEDDDWQLVPNAQEFSVPAGGETRLPLRVIPHRSIVAGSKRLNAHVTLAADQTYSIDLTFDLEVGLKNIDLAPAWTVARNPITGQMDLIVSQAVTNHGQAPVTLDVFLLAEGISQNRRTVASLGRGETAVRTFRIANGAALLAGKQIRVGLAERDGLTRLNQILAIPQHVAQPPTHAAAETSD